jgi:hypothetical protein
MATVNGSGLAGKSRWELYIASSLVITGAVFVLVLSGVAWFTPRFIGSVHAWRPFVPLATSGILFCFFGLVIYLRKRRA